MDQARSEHLGDDLRGLVAGSVLTDPVTLTLYSSDGSPFFIRPLAVVHPRHEADVQAVVRYAREQGVPVIARGAGTNPAGAAIGAGIVLDFARYMNSVLEIGSDWVRVQPGVVLSQLEQRLATRGLHFAPQPFNPATRTIGGLIAADAAGPDVAATGLPHDHFLGCRLILDSGDAVNLAVEPIDFVGERPERFQELHRGLTGLLRREKDALAKHSPRSPYDRGSYAIYTALRNDAIDYPRMLSGSEGTLGIFTELKLRIGPPSGGRAGVMLAFATLDSARAALGAVLATRPIICDLLDRRLLTPLRSQYAELAKLVPGNAEAVLSVEFADQSTAAAQHRVAQLSQHFSTPDVTVITAVHAEELIRQRRLIADAFPSLDRLRGGSPAVAGLDDCRVPPERLPDFLIRLQELLLGHECTAALLVHAVIGRLRLKPYVDPTQPADSARLWALAENLHALVLDAGGSIGCGECLGLARTPWIGWQHPELTPIIRDVKTLFDPTNIFNPEKVVSPEPRPTSWPMPTPLNWPTQAELEGSVTRAGAMPLLVWSSSEVLDELQACSRCGDCRTSEPPQRMCPIFRAEPDEAASPRAKVELLRSLFRDNGAAPSWSAQDVREVADLCVNCKMCGFECPSRVNVPKLMLETKAQHIAEHGLNRHQWAMARIESFSAASSRVAPFANLALGNPFARWLMEKALGISRRRKLPPFARRNAFRRARHYGWDRKPAAEVTRKLAYFTDVFAAYHDPSIAEATLRVLKHNGFTVYVPPQQFGSGSAPWAQGDLETARSMARKNLRLLGPLVREGFRIVCSEPTAALMLRHDYLDIVDDPDAREVSEATHEITALLWEEHAAGNLRTDFEPLPLNVGHHVPCHVKALRGPVAGPKLLALIPEFRPHTIDVGCSGMAGTFGLGAQNDATSRAAGRDALAAMSRPRIQFGSTECSTCRMQIEDSTSRRTLHPVQYLALAYGLMPRLAERLNSVPNGLLLR